MHWSQDALVYHLYPLGCLDAPARNDFHSAPVPRLEALHGWLDHLQSLGVSALYLGPLFESTAHGYDTADYFHVDRRLGTDESLRAFADALHGRGIRLVLDGVFNHVGRDFWAFRDVRERGAASPYRHWFHLDFSRRSPAGDPFWYEGWNGHYDLVKLDVHQPDVRAHLFAAVTSWVERFGIDGLRLDAADVLDRSFQRALADHCRRLRSDFWLVGEVIHGDYRTWTAQGGLDAVTNYELYKGLYSSHNDRNYFELAHTLDRQFGPRGMYRDLTLYSFADNHDVDRVASVVRQPAHLYPLHLLLLTMPGTPSLYYGSERGIEGRKHSGSDAPLRPPLTPARLEQAGAHPELQRVITTLARIRREHPSLRRGRYQSLHVASEQLAFSRSCEEETIIVAVNAASAPARVALSVPGTRLVDVLDGATFEASGGRVELPLDPSWGRILRVA